jgi:hypothetical protein
MLQSLVVLLTQGGDDEIWAAGHRLPLGERDLDLTARCDQVVMHVGGW